MQDTETLGQTLTGLIERVASGDEDAFEELYERTARRVYGLALRIIHNPAMAAETVQEVYLQVWQQAAAYSAIRGTPQSWIFTLTHRRAVDRVRAERSSTERGSRHAQEVNALKHDSVEDTVSRSLMTQAVKGCLSVLTIRESEAIVLAYYDGLTYAQVAHSLGLKLPTVKSRIHSGLARLRQAMEQQGYDKES